MIKLIITDPQSLDEDTLVATARYFMNLAGHDIGVMPQQAEAMLQQPPALDKPMTLDVNGAGKKVINPLDDLAPIAPPSPPIAPIAPEIDINTLDSAGDIWNPEIHSRTKSKTADGRWKPKTRMNVANQPVVVPIKPKVEVVSQTGVATEEIELIPDIFKQRLGELPRYEARPNKMLYLPEHDVLIEESDLESWRKPYEMNFDIFMKKITGLMTARKITNSELIDLIQGFGVPSPFMLADKQELLPDIDDALTQLIENKQNGKK